MWARPSEVGKTRKGGTVDRFFCLRKVWVQAYPLARGDSDSENRSSDLSIAKKASIETSVKTKVGKKDFQEPAFPSTVPPRFSPDPNRC